MVIGEETGKKEPEENKPAENNSLDGETLEKEVPAKARELSREKGRENTLELSRLTRQERQVAELIKQGMTNREIGEELCISEATVKKHVSNIFEKLGIASRRELR
ncbi:MAG: LuxR C-terminal-related transcriptional regulator [Lachnospiraceae bacterium]|nr:LuxR C-terminal-related transcriptional regulator [Lachnospiraceae bacterium]